MRGIVVAVAISVVALFAQGDAAELFRQGRDAIDGGNWVAAETRLRSFVEKYPKHERADAALYYLAFTLKKQGRIAEADECLRRLTAGYPQSTWKADAEAMRVEMNRGDAALTARSLRAEDDRIRATALRNVYRDDPEKGRAECAKLLASGNLRIAGFCVQLLSQAGDGESVALLTSTARMGTIPEVRAMAVTALAQRPDGVRTAKEILLRDETRVAEMSLYALYGQHKWMDTAFLKQLMTGAANERARGGALLLLSAERDATGLAMSVYESARSGLLRKFALDALWRCGAREQLAQIAKGAREADVQAAAQYYLSGPQGAEAADALRRWYEAEPVEDVKMNILALLSLTQTAAAGEKLRSVRQSDRSARLRAQAEALVERGDIKIPMPLGQKQLPIRR